MISFGPLYCWPRFSYN